MSGPPAAVAATRVAVRRALEGLPAGPVLVACSGGADSLALAAATAFVAPRAGRLAGAVVVDHGLQAGSAAVAHAAARTCAGLGLHPVDVAVVRVGGRGGPEAAARAARRAALAAAADACGAVAVLLGHTRDDQAETVLLRLARGSGARSLAAMAPLQGRWARPLLGLDRATVRAAAEAQGLLTHADPHNEDPRYARARVRARALPALEAALGPGVAAALARSAELLRADADLLDTLARGARTDDCAALAELPAALRGRVLRMLLLEAGVPPGALAARHVDAVQALVDGWRGQGEVALPGRLVARRRCGRLEVVPRPPDPGPLSGPAGASRG